MKIIEYKCDLCQKINCESRVWNLDIPTDREMDASGNGYNQNYIQKDICFVCVNNILIKHFENGK